mmetsp:Transcript_10388/g.21073  ORF Transcript_10388/g.21073 Transcript_10388/m.21073 type:complete len:456 (-) Transcript_10388:199-1566(-)
MLFKLIPDISVRELFSVFVRILDCLVGCLLMLPRLLILLNVDISAASEHRNTTDTKPNTCDAGPNQRPTSHNDANSSATSENWNTMNHETLWKSLGFTDEIDRRDFGSYWNQIKKLKYNHPSLKSTRPIIPRGLDQSFCKEAWIRLGLYLAKNDFIQEVNSCSCDVITDEVLESMFGCVIWTPKERIKTMDLSHCSITSVGIKRLIPFVKAATSITEFLIKGNKIGAEGFGLVATALCGRQIEELFFEDCAIKDIVPALMHCKFPELKSFYFYGNQIGDKGAKFIADKFLQSSPKLETLELSKCGISDRGAKSIADALASNATLKELWLDHNSISDEGVASFANALHNNHTLKTLIMDNSTAGWSDTSTQYQDLQFALKMNIVFEKDLESAKWMKEKYFTKDGNGLKCAVCLQNKSEFFFFLPCGHKICTDCNDLYDKDICHLCKKKIEKRQRLY